MVNLDALANEWAAPLRLTGSSFLPYAPYGSTLHTLISTEKAGHRGGLKNNKAEYVVYSSTRTNMAFNWKPPSKSPPAAKTSTTQCKSCGGTDFDDFCESGDRACAWCGTVLQENGIVSTVQFSESGGSSNVVGQFVSGDKGRPSGGGAGGRARGRFGQSRDSRETTIQNGKKKIIQVCGCGCGCWVWVCGCITFRFGVFVCACVCCVA